MKKAKMRSVKAWAVVTKGGAIYKGATLLMITKSKHAAGVLASSDNRRTVRVIITEVPRKRK